MQKRLILAHNRSYDVIRAQESAFSGSQ